MLLVLRALGDHVQMQPDSVLLPSCLGIFLSSYPYPQVAVVVPAFQPRNVKGRAGATSHLVQVDLGPPHPAHVHLGFSREASDVVVTEISELLYVSNKLGRCHTLWAPEPTPWAGRGLCGQSPGRLHRGAGNGGCRRHAHRRSMHM